MKHLKKKQSSKTSSYIDMITQNPQEYAEFNQKNKSMGLAIKKNRVFKSLGIGVMAVFMGILT
ncbi:MAG: hypothetical protein IKV69_02585, partial [Clostridia bacterium]|nr:hypothetical protein [Clostridia bacterium]